MLTLISYKAKKDIYIYAIFFRETKVKVNIIIANPLLMKRSSYETQQLNNDDA